MAGSMDRVHEVVHGRVHGPGPWGGPWPGPWTGSMGWSMDPGPCFGNTALLLQFVKPSILIHLFENTPQTGEIPAKMPGFRFRVYGKHFQNGAFRER